MKENDIYPYFCCNAFFQVRFLFNCFGFWLFLPRPIAKARTVPACAVCQEDTRDSPPRHSGHLGYQFRVT